MTEPQNFFKLGLLGWPLSHSLSPLLHQTALRAVGLEGDYALYPIHPDSEAETALAQYVHAVSAGELAGLNVTIPYKIRIMPYLTEMTPAARKIGAVNTVFASEGGVWGDNTDAGGFEADLAWCFGDDFLSSSGQVLVLGAGGAARAVVFTLASAGWHVIIAARRPAQAEGLVENFQDLSGDLTPVIFSVESLKRYQPKLVVNATPVGMWPKVDETPWPEGLPLPAGAVVYDLVYRPSRTGLIQQALLQGLPAFNGSGMLAAQAALAFAGWTGLEPPLAGMRQALDRFLEKE